MKTNDYLEFYKRNSISPVHMTEHPIGKHILNRRNLYRQLGIPMQCFRDKDVLEFGPGGGMNSLVLLLEEVGNIRHIDLVEANSTGQKEILELFKNNNIASEKFDLYKMMLEDYFSDKKYDFVIAEQFLPHIPNHDEALMKIMEFVNKDGVLIITAVDETGLYVEMMKRAVAQFFARDIDDYDTKVIKLCELYGSSLKVMKNMTRPVKDWIEDQMLNPAILLDNPLNIKDAIEITKKDFDLLGCSQNIFVDLSWYKDSNYNLAESYKKQYDLKIQNFLLAGDDEESLVDKDINDNLEKYVRLANRLAAKMERSADWSEIGLLISYIEKVSKYTNKKQIHVFNAQLTSIMITINEGKVIDLNKYPEFLNTFGKSSQFVSFQRKA